ncbi:Ig-like domain-containing protein [Halobacterium rubrum]|uniref:Ig-like domain-containing protein n=1 Tax=Halobacterium TaxID=2239 RepID=UPI001F27AA44|nr:MULTISPECIES: Ig-like domain-containing protein [Halobacterium]MDH5021707.1 Ig-like domain-containing protein [Halobacterium rubrum]
MLGIVLLALILAAVYAIAQSTVAPQVRETTEYNHAIDTLSDMQSLQVDTISAADTGSLQGSIVKMGATYPFKFLFIHSTDPTGTIKTTESKPLSIENAVARDNETADYIDGRELVYQSVGLRYSPDYSEYRSAPDLEITPSGVLYADHPSTRKVINEPAIVDGRTISLTATDGELYSSQGLPQMMHVMPLSTSSTTVRVTNETDASPVTVTMDTELNLSTWRQILKGEIDSDTSRTNPRSDSDSQYIAEVDKSGETLELVFETGESYLLELSKLGFKRASQPTLSEASQPNVTYLTAESDQDPTVVENNTVELAVEVRDSMNNPVSDVKVSASAPAGDISRPAKLSGTDGEVRFEYTAPEIIADTSVKDSETYQVTTQIGVGSGTQVVVVFEVQVQNSYN